MKSGAFLPVGHDSWKNMSDFTILRPIFLRFGGLHLSSSSEDNPLEDSRQLLQHLVVWPSG
jgi:hypothetical protein